MDTIIRTTCVNCTKHIPAQNLNHANNGYGRCYICTMLQLAPISPTLKEIRKVQYLDDQSVNYEWLFTNGFLISFRRYSPHIFADLPLSRASPGLNHRSPTLNARTFNDDGRFFMQSDSGDH